MKVMKWSVIALAVAAGTSQMALASQQSEAKGFVEDANLDLLLRTTYFNRDYKDNRADARSLGQGFITTFESGFTQGTVGVGVDAYGILGVRLDGGRGHTYGAMFERDSNGDPERDLSQAGAAVKLQFSNTVIKYGNQFPSLPVLAYDDSRLLPESFTGTLITSNEIEGLELNAGRFTADSAMQSSSRDSLNYLDLTLKSIDVVGGTYAFTDNLSASLYYADNEDIAKKKYANVNYVMPLTADQSLAFDFNIYDNKYDKRAFGETQDTTIWSLSAKYSVGSHAFILAHQRVTGDGNYEYDIGDGGSSIWVANSYYSDFNSKDERSWQASYELDFSDYGVPGLFWKTAYVYGDNVDTGTGEGKETEFFNQVQYVVQSGPAKDLSLKLRNSIYRSNSDMRNYYSEDLNEIRAFIEYPLSIL
ncbi:OprD family porin [Stutzerimonas degradans]|uniref:Outer membrane porin, OprD family n=1 Tax=Stutzerimonas degradans TaxID=2968968 RepID=A0A4P9DZ50_9GAMM|nr:OprD family porin [Stutzerimonas degradans]MCQ4276552.1 OprD family porin [Stutzerimonas degradans]PNF76083.1 outer membrane porin, OprD family [Stutzerimonas degradans]QCT97415.1 OprD family porin [Stutzerimonas degradans]QPT21780.1 OprD family porin [Stutzerimonas degradans]